MWLKIVFDIFFSIQTELEPDLYVKLHLLHRSTRMREPLTFFAYFTTLSFPNSNCDHKKLRFSQQQGASPEHLKNSRPLIVFMFSLQTPMEKQKSAQEK